jgi:2'-5' RNA ligase
MSDSRTRLYFFAAVPPTVLRYLDEAGDLGTSRAGRLVRPDRRHMTLLDLSSAGGSEDDVIVAAHHAMARMPPCVFHVVFDELVVSPERALLHPSRPLIGARAAQAHLLRTLAASGLLLSSAPPAAHVTLGYSCRAPFGVWPVLPISWAVTELLLVRSHVGATRHERLARWTLPPQPRIAA